jgi:protein gp37
VSEGCRNCYAERASARLAANPMTDRYAGVAEFVPGVVAIGPDAGLRYSSPRWTGTVRFHPEILDQPLRWQRPRRIFVCSMSDLFHPGVLDEQIAAIFGVMATCPQHTFQVLTKRPERAMAWFRGGWPGYNVLGAAALLVAGIPEPGDSEMTWPLANVWMGTSVEDQATADERIPQLLACPAAVRFVSYEPALGPVDFTRIGEHVPEDAFDPAYWLDSLRGHMVGPDDILPSRVDWVIVGGESGPGARPFDLRWAESVVAQCRDAGVACFVKQLGAFPVTRRRDVERLWPGGTRWTPDDTGEWIEDWPKLRDSKGGDWLEWPNVLQLREFPA